jgi:predicted outer membrane repeat protein
MEYKKSMIIIILAIFLFSIASVCASDTNDTAIASEDTTAIELSQSDEMTASDDSNVMEQIDDEELILEDNDVDKPILGEKASTGSFTDLNDLINNQYYSNDTITLSCNYTFNGTDDDDSGFIHGIGINRGVTIDGNGCTIDGSQKARIFNIGNGGSVKFLNINFINGKATGIGWEEHGGAISAEYRNCVVECCNFTNNTAEFEGGALMRVNAYNCTFTGNKAIGGDGGAIKQGSAYNCTFTGNKAIVGDGGAIDSGSAYNCVFTGNTAKYYGGAIDYGSAYNCVFTGNTAVSGGAINEGSAYNCTFTGNTAVSGGAIAGNYVDPGRYSATLCMFGSNTPDDYIYIRIVNVVLSADNLTTSYKSGDRLLFNLTADNTNYVGFNTTIKIYQDKQEMGTYYALSGEGWIVDLSPGTYKAVLSLDKYDGVTQGVATITVNKAKTKLLANPITAAYNTNKKMVITLTDSNGKPLNGVKLTVKIKSDKTYTTDKNGQVKISVGKLTPKTYNVKITFGENANYLPSSANVKVTVKKAKSKITAKKKTVKKAKKYAITLKSGKTPIKKAKVILKIKKKTFKAKTNKKGKATFKIKKLKKGKYTAKITFKGNKYYNKLNKNVKIIVKK